MQKTTIIDTDIFRVDSYGHGIAYTFTHKGANRSLYLQGDEAAEFRQQLYAMENTYPNWETEKILSLLWCDYEEVADRDEPDVETDYPKL